MSHSNMDLANDFNDKNDISTEHELEQTRLRREKNDFVSKELGKLLLRGYRMLDSTCDACGCILMQLRDNPTHCVNCAESDVLKLKSTATPLILNSKKNDKVTAANIQTKSYENIQSEEVEKYDSDIVATKLSNLLLKGYKMLDSTCVKCGCILMRKKNENVLCVVCDDPSTSKNKFQTSQINMETERIPTDIPIIQNEHSNETIDKSTPIYAEFNKVEETLLNKIDWAKNQLLNTNDVRKNIDLCELIRTASEACLSVGKLYRSQNYFTN